MRGAWERREVKKKKGEENLQLRSKCARWGDKPLSRGQRILARCRIGTLALAIGKHRKERILELGPGKDQSYF